MLREQMRLLKYGMMALDAFLVGIAFWLAYYARSIAPDFIPSLPNIGPPSGYYWIMLVAIPIWLLLLHHFRIYDHDYVRKSGAVLLGITKSSFFGFIVLSAVVYFLDRKHFPRALVIALATTSWATLLLGRILLLLSSKWLRKRGVATFSSRNILLIGTDNTLRRFLHLIDLHRGWGLNVVGYLDGFCSEDLSNYNVKLLGHIREIARVLEENIVDEVLVAVPPDKLGGLRDAIRKCEEVGVKVHIAAEFFDDLSSRTEMEEFGGIPVLTLTRVPHHGLQLFTKRIIDFVISALALLVSLPVFVITAILIRIDSKGDVFFKQKRCGLNGRRFTMYKFRTMYVDAEERLKEVMHLNRMKGPVFKADNDPRVTRIGRLLRKLSIDELPQLWNVIKGDMSIVGPRPPIPQEVESYERWQRRRLSMRPGITCLWQISGRNDIDFDDWMRLDLQYIDNWSLWLDAKIILKTFPAVLSTKGAR